MCAAAFGSRRKLGLRAALGCSCCFEHVLFCSSSLDMRQCTELNKGDVPYLTVRLSVHGVLAVATNGVR